MRNGKPEVLDHVYVSSRDAEGLNPLGQIIALTSDDEAVVKFFGSSKIAYYDTTTPDVSAWLAGGGESDSYALDLFAGAWSSHDGGEGEWQI